MAERPSIDRGEITDKGYIYINQRAVLRNRAALVDMLHGVASAPPGILPVEFDGAA